MSLPRAQHYPPNKQKNPKNDQALSEGIREHNTEKRGWHWALTSFAFEVWAIRKKSKFAISNLAIGCYLRKANMYWDANDF